MKDEFVDKQGRDNGCCSFASSNTALKRFRLFHHGYDIPSFRPLKITLSFLVSIPCVMRGRRIVHKLFDKNPGQNAAMVMSFNIQHVHIKSRQNFRAFHTPPPQHNEWNCEVRTRSSLRARNTSRTVSSASNKRLTRQKEDQMLGG